MKTCTRCSAHLGAEAFSKRQWKSSAPVCAPCLLTPAPVAPIEPGKKVKACAGICGLALTADSFTKRQWKQAKPRCNACVATPAMSAHFAHGTGPFGTGAALASDPSEPWPFAIDALDQCETPLLAYEHIAPLLRLLAGSLGRSASALKVYDPYYCTGASKAHLSRLGFTSVHHKKECFYTAISRRTTPDFDVLVTNPPWSGNHIERCLRFCRASGKPWFVLLPNFCYLNTERDHFGKIMSLTYSAGASPAEPLCVVPRTQYRYQEQFLKSARDVRTRHFALWCADLCAAAPAILTKGFWAGHTPTPAGPPEGASAEAVAAWQAGADTVRSLRHLPYHALDARDPRKRTLAASRRKLRLQSDGGGAVAAKRRRGVDGSVVDGGDGDEFR